MPSALIERAGREAWPPTPPIACGALVHHCGDITVFEHAAQGEDGQWAMINGSTRPRIESWQPPRGMFGCGCGWALSLAGLVLAFWRPGPAAAGSLVGAVILMAAGSHLVHIHHDRRRIALVVETDGLTTVLASRSPTLGDNVDALHEAVKALLHTANARFADEAQGRRHRPHPPQRLD